MLYMLALLQETAAAAGHRPRIRAHRRRPGRRTRGRRRRRRHRPDRWLGDRRHRPPARRNARIQTAMIIAAALVEGVALFVAVIGLLIQWKITF